MKGKCPNCKREAKKIRPVYKELNFVFRKEGHLCEHCEDKVLFPTANYKIPVQTEKLIRPGRKKEDLE